MRIHPVFAALNIPPGSTLDQVERGLMDHVKDHIQSAADNYDDAHVQKEERYLRQIYPLFFDYSILWIKGQLSKNAGERPLPEALQLKKEARQVLTSLQNDILAFAVCYMHITRFMTLVRDEIKRSDMKAAGFGQKKIQWTSETGVMLGQSKKRKLEIQDLEIRYNEALDVFATIQGVQERFEQGLMAAFPREEAEKTLRGFRSSLRMSDFERTRQVLAGIGSLPGKTPQEHRQALQKAGEQILDVFQENAALLVGDEKKLFLTAHEIRVMQAAHQEESRKIRAIMLKYSLPYMEYKLQNLSRFLDKLMVIGSTEGLMTLYHKLIVGMGSPLRSLEDIRKYESDVLGLIKHLQSSQFQEIPKIYESAKQIVEEFHQARSEYEADMEDHLREEGAAEDQGDQTRQVKA